VKFREFRREKTNLHHLCFFRLVHGQAGEGKGWRKRSNFNTLPTALLCWATRRQQKAGGRKSKAVSLPGPGRHGCNAPALAQTYLQLQPELQPKARISHRSRTALLRTDAHPDDNCASDKRSQPRAADSRAGEVMHLTAGLLRKLQRFAGSRPRNDKRNQH